MLADYPEPYHGRLPGLVERALRWHRVEPDVRAEVVTLGGSAMPTQRPPIVGDGTGARFETVPARSSLRSLGRGVS